MYWPRCSEPNLPFLESILVIFRYLDIHFRYFLIFSDMHKLLIQNIHPQFIILIVHIICDSCDEIYVNRIFNSNAMGDPP